MKRIIQIAAMAFVFLLWAPVGYACWCFKPEVKQAFDRAKVVFTGEVLEVIPPRNPESAKLEDAAHTIRFRVETAWKEPFWTEANVLVRMDSCFGLRTLPKKGEKYLVYAEPFYSNDLSSTQLRTDSCTTRTTLVSEISPAGAIYYRNQADDDIRMLNAMTMFPPRSSVFNPFRIRWP